MKKLDAGDFARWLKQIEESGCGYIMCAVGQSPTRLSSWYFEQYNPKSGCAGDSASAENYKKALYWKKNAPRVFDCQGLADCYVTEMTGKKTNVKARENYADWCATRGSGVIPAVKRKPGAAVFMHSDVKKYITHVGFLCEPVDKSRPEGDWWIVEARGVQYGVVKTKLSKRAWNRWGLMEKYFDYGAQEHNYTVTGGSVYLWRGHPDCGGVRAEIVHRGDALSKPPSVNYIPVCREGEIRWINSKYVTEATAND